MKRATPVYCLILAFSLTFLVQPASQVAAQQQPQPADATQSNTTTTLSLAGLRERVTVRRDARGIPYIEAANEPDLFFAQGYIAASDRLWQMELFRRTARGELAEIFGAGPKDSVLNEDKRRRTYGFARLAEAQVQLLTPRVRTTLEDYARGVNAFIASRETKTLPPEFQILQLKPREWRVSDSLVIGKLFDELLSTSWRADLMRASFLDLPKEKYAALFPQTSPLDVVLVGSDDAKQKKTARIANTSSSLQAAKSLDTPAKSLETLEALASDALMMERSLARTGLAATDFNGSNNWVVNGSRTATGKPLLANDPHLPASAPSIWYMMHLSGPSVRVAGVSVAGLPGVAIGHNQSIAWGVTSLEPDVQDLYSEKFDREKPQRYLTPKGWVDAEVRHEEIKVRKGFVDTSTETVPFDVTVTRHGPIIFEQGDARYALRWTSLDQRANLVETFSQLMFARDWKEFRDALKDYSGTAFNMIYADTKGHIGYYGIGQFPIRKSGSGQLPYDGSTDEGEWTGFIPFDALPHLYDPPSGLIVTANSRIVGHDYPYQLTVSPIAAYRARRIYDLLAAKPKLTIEDYRAIQGDTYSIPGVTFAREFVRVARAAQPAASDDAKWAESLRLLDEWDGRVVPESRAALMVAHLRTAFRQRMLEAAVGVERARLYTYTNADTLIDRLITERPAAWLPKDFKSYAELLRACYADARAELTKSYGVDESKWTWGREALVRFPHPLAQVPLIGQQFVVPPFPQNGSLGNLTTVNRGSSVSMRLIADTADWDRTQQGIAPGESGDPNSPHWQDQLSDWRAVTPAVFPFTDTAIHQATRETLLLTPAK